MGEGAQAFGDGILTPTGLALLGHLPQRGGRQVVRQSPWRPLRGSWQPAGLAEGALPRKKRETPQRLPFSLFLTP